MNLYAIHFDNPNHQPGEPGRDCAANVNQLIQAIQAALQVKPSVPVCRWTVNSAAMLNQVGAVPAQSIVVVHGHGGEDDSSVSYDTGTTVTADQVVATLRQYITNQGTGVTICCVVCYSALADHLGPKCKAAFPKAEVLATVGPHGGGLCRTTRRGYSGASFDTQMRQID